MRKLLTFLIALSANVAAVVSPVSAQLAGGLMFPGPGSPASSGGGGRTCTDDTASTNFLARTSGLSNTEKDGACNFIKTLEANGLITGNLSGAAGCGTFSGGGGIDAIYLIATGSAANAALNVCGTGYSLAVNGSPPFTADSGYVGAASAYLDTQFNPAALSGQNYTQNSAGIWGWTLTNFVINTDYGSMAANGSGSLNDRLYPHYSTNAFYPAINQSGLTAHTAVGHFYGITRDPANSGSTQYTDYVDTTGATVGTASITPVGPTLVLLADSTAAANPFAGNLGFFAITSGLSATRGGQLYAAAHTYMQSVAGAP
jgi:hypothetical protein